LADTTCRVITPLPASPRSVLWLGVVHVKFPLVRVAYAPLSEVHLPLRIGNSPVSHPAAYALNASDATAPGNGDQARSITMMLLL